MKHELIILGTRGIPAKHGGFETFAEKIALYLVHKSNWNVTVYCQVYGNGEITEDNWNGIKRVHIPIKSKGALSTVLFDLKSVIHSFKKRKLILTLGYNTAVFNILFRLVRVKNIINMDGLEWKREKWTLNERIWLYINERAGCLIGNHLIADHPEIKKHLLSRVNTNKITMIPYGANFVESANIQKIESLGLKNNNYCIVIARPEPENNILEIVKAFSNKKRNLKLVVLGNFNLENNLYHKSVFDAASDEVIFPGAIYDSDVVESLRFFAKLYIHGHSVGGTNPSLVEALGAGVPVLAHKNKFNRWVAGESAKYFSDEYECEKLLDTILSDDENLNDMSIGSVRRFKCDFTWEKICDEYEKLLMKFIC